jgi:hypothetical protein
MAYLYITLYTYTCIFALQEFVKKKTILPSYLSQVVGVLNMQENGNVRAALSTTDVIEVRIGDFLFFKLFCCS